MFKIGFFLLFLTVVFSCNKARPTHQYHASWDTYTDPGLQHFKLYTWSGEDSAECPFVDNSPAYRYKKYFQKIIAPGDTSEFTEVADGISYIRVALCAVDTAGTESMITVSPFLKAVKE